MDDKAVTFDEFEKVHEEKIWNKLGDATGKLDDATENASKKTAMVVSALIGGIVVVVILIITCSCYICMKRCNCDCDCCMNLGKTKHGPADECKDAKPHYTLNIDEFYDKNGGKNKEIDIRDEDEEHSTDALQQAPKPKRFNTIHNNLDNTVASGRASREASFYVVNDSKASMKRQSTQH